MWFCDGWNTGRMWEMSFGRSMDGVGRYYTSSFCNDAASDVVQQSTTLAILVWNLTRPRQVSEELRLSELQKHRMVSHELRIVTECND